MTLVKSKSKKNSIKFRIAGAVVGAVAMSSFLVTAAGASYGGATLGGGVTPGTIVVGQSLVVSGGGYDGAVRITIIIDGKEILVGHTTANASGTFKADIKIPARTSPGRHTILFWGAGRSGGRRIDRLSILVHKG